MKRFLVFLVNLGLLALLVALSACARQGYPSGGPKDSKAPVSLGTSPVNESRNFTARQFYIQFDEYVVLKNAEQNVIVSPPMDPKPEFTTKGRGVLVKIKDTLQSGTTYLFQFKEAIADFTEGNLLPSFEYVFSTGETMDTMMLAGRVEDALSGKPWNESVTVMAYRGDDTVASRVTRTDKDGHFAFHYIPAGDYRLVAVEDKNRDLSVGTDEAVAWLENSFAAVDSVDSTGNPLLRISAPRQTRQRVLKSEMPMAGRIVIVTALPMQHPTVSGEALEYRLNGKGDTLSAWCLNPKCDSTVIVLSDEGLQDTLKLRYRKPRRPSAQTQQSQPLVRSLCTGQTAWYDRLYLAFTNPVVSVADSLEVEVMYMKDSSVSRCRVEVDSTGLRALILASLKADEEYSMRIPAKMFTDIYGTASDSLRFTLKPKDYAILTMQIENTTGIPLVVELLDSKDTVLQRHQLRASELRLTHIAAGTYRLRAILDADNNGRWTEGDYRLGRQPEEWVMFEKLLQLRERWEMEEKWTVERGKRKVESVKMQDGE